MFQKRIAIITLHNFSGCFGRYKLTILVYVKPIMSPQTFASHHIVPAHDAIGILYLGPHYVENVYDFTNIYVDCPLYWWEIDLYNFNSYMWSADKIPSNIVVCVCVGVTNTTKCSGNKTLQKGILFRECLGSSTEKTFSVVVIHYFGRTHWV
jgi:hypothetical protein